MSTAQGFPFKKHQLVTSVRAAIFTAAAVAAPIATAADTTPIHPVVQTQQADFSVADESIQYAVADLTTVAASEADAIAESSTGDAAIVISNDANINAGDASVSFSEDSLRTTENTALKSEHSQGSKTFVGIAKADDIFPDVPEEGETANLEVKFDSEYSPEQVEEVFQVVTENYGDIYKIGRTYGGIAESQGEPLSLEQFVEGNSHLVKGETISVYVADEGEAVVDNAAGILAESDSGDIVISNSGDITVGNGERQEYWTGFRHIEGYGTNFVVNMGEYDADGNAILHTLITKSSMIDQGMYGGRVLNATAYAAGIKAESETGDITIMNDGAVTGGTIAAGIEAHTDEGDIAITNSGDISVGEGGTAIVASTQRSFETLYTYDWSGETVVVNPAVAPGENGLVPNGTPEQTITYVNVYNDIKVNQVDGTDSVITIENSGALTIGENGTGIKANNPSGDLITIENSGDITLTGGDSGHAIYASTAADFKDSNVEVSQEIENGGTAFLNRDHHTDPFFTDYSEKTITTYFDSNIFLLDRGDIEIVNSGNIDISAVEGEGVAGIQASSYGAITIENSGNIDVGAEGKGISTFGPGETNATNSGDISLSGSGAQAIVINSVTNPRGNGVSTALEQAGGGLTDFTNSITMLAGGDTHLTNSGNITSVNDGHNLQYNDKGQLIVTRDDEGEILESGIAAAQTGIEVGVLNSNIRGAEDVIWAQYGSDAVEWINTGKAEEDKIVVRDKIEIYEAHVVNSGDITLGQNGTAMTVTGVYGKAFVENSGTIHVGSTIIAEADDGLSIVRDRVAASTGIRAKNGGQAVIDFDVTNTAEGKIYGGDASFGILARALSGSSYVTNDGLVHVENGIIIEANEHHDGFIAQSVGIQAFTSQGLNAYAGVVNNGTVKTGNDSFGIIAANASTHGGLVNPDLTERDPFYTAFVTNSATGVIETGDNATGIGVLGFYTQALNQGSIAIGDGHEHVESGYGQTWAAGIKTLNRWGQSRLINEGTITGGDAVAGIYAQGALAYAENRESGIIVVGDDSMGTASYASYTAVNRNDGQIIVGDRSIGMHSFGSSTIMLNTGDIQVGDHGKGMSSVAHAGNITNQGNIVVGQGSSGISVHAGAYASTVINEGTITSLEDGNANFDAEGHLLPQGNAIESTGDSGARIYNAGVIQGSIILNDADDFLYNTIKTDPVTGAAVSSGVIELTSDVIDMGEGQNEFRNTFGDITFSGDNEINLGSEGVMNNYSSTGSYVTITSIDGSSDDTLMINGDVNFTTSGTHTGLLNLEMDSQGTDQIMIDGDFSVNKVVDGFGNTEQAKLNLVLTPTEQLKGKSQVLIYEAEAGEEPNSAAITITGENNSEGFEVAGFGGEYALTILDSEMVQDEQGNWVLDMTTGLAPSGAAASSIPYLASNFWHHSVGNYMTRRAGTAEGLSVWGSGFNTETDAMVSSDVEGQELSFSQILAGAQIGAGYKSKNVAASIFMGTGSADGSQEVSHSEAKLNTRHFGLSVSYAEENFYADFVYQTLNFDARINASGSEGATDGTVKGFSLEGGYKYALESGLVVMPQLQYSSVELEVDDFAESAGTFFYGYNLEGSKRTRLGLNLHKSFSIKEGTLMPYATLSWVDNQGGEQELLSNGVAFGTDLSGSGYQIDAGLNANVNDWVVNTGIGVIDGDAEASGISVHFSLNYNWK